MLVGWPGDAATDGLAGSDGAETDGLLAGLDGGLLGRGALPDPDGRDRKTPSPASTMTTAAKATKRCGGESSTLDHLLPPPERAQPERAVLRAVEPAWVSAPVTLAIAMAVTLAALGLRRRSFVRAAACGAAGSGLTCLPGGTTRTR